MNADQHRKAKSVVAWLAKAENPEAPDYPIDRVKAERWPEVCAAVEVNPDLSAKTIAERLGPEHSETEGQTPRSTNRPEPQSEPRTPPTSKDRARERVAEIKAQLRHVTKLPIPERTQP